MRYLFVLIALLFFSCEDEANTPDGLLKEMNSIEAQINQLVSTDCASGTSCKTAAIGAKPCGGPTHYIIYASVSNTTQFENLISRFNELNKELNAKTGAVSDCAIQNPPELVCESGTCVEKQ